ncbi:hypothetical protein CFC21_065414 [Triticum aestivum]|uniref:DUF7032 domain-containing protein n=3 Tax=Triticum TaxID=4564 RepID=A0A9R0WM45_TRITD|nr:vacuolar protein 8-like [Triticum dicoccoides]XP_037433923.1 vacuolar protein 8-like [Triticum dicoccoides]XP_044380809.1 vacuolar protein 8-like [Triticum aestivum]XP_044380810.1 vacuolar protein 8-like [Triticum aestivum]VAI16699.1 unnamed protein product [Triticum turgidum subsp. durum]KAF7058333.1 hypothetical protein CFC21_065414 [Triticum aestivum]
MTPPPSPSPPPPAAADALAQILHALLPPLLLAAASANALHSRWRALHATLLALQSSLVSAPAPAAGHPLFADLVASLLPPLRSLHALSARCQDPALPGGRLRLQSDLDIAASSLTLLLHDLSLLLRSGLLSVDSSASSPNAIVLQVPAAAASRSDKSLFIRDAFARLQIGGLDLKLKALASLLELLGNDPAAEAANIVAADGDVAALLRMLDASAHSALRDRAAAVVALLATACSASRKAVFDEGGLGPLLRVLDSASAPATRERAVVAIEAMTADAGSAWAVSAYGGVSILINACRPGSGSLAVQALAVAAIKNVVSIDDVRSALVEEGGLPVLVDLLACGTTDTQKNAVICLWSIASMGDLETQQQIVQDGALPPLLQALHITTDLDLQNSVLRAIHVLAVVPSAARILCSSPLFFAQLTDLMRRGGSILLQQMAADMIADLAPGVSDDTKRCMAPCVGTLVKMMEVAKPASVQESAGRALLALMTLKSNRKELVRDEKNLTRLVQMLNPRNEEIDKKHPVSVLLALAMGGGNGTRRRLADAGACQHLQKLADAEVPCAKKALQRISSSRFKSLLSRGWNN